MVATMTQGRFMRKMTVTIIVSNERKP